MVGYSGPEKRKQIDKYISFIAETMPKWSANPVPRVGPCSVGYLLTISLANIVKAQHSVPSPDGALIATLHTSSLFINAYNGAALRSFSLTPEIVSKCRFVRWSQRDDPMKQVLSGQEDEKQTWPCSRILLADDDNVRVYDVNDPHWCGRIECAASNLGRIADVAFGHQKNELLIFSDFGVKLTIWSLITCRGVEIRDPKYLVPCYTYRPRTGHMAVLTRPHAHDILMLLTPGDHGLIESVELPTLDAQEVKWSPDGRWLAIRDAASHGHRLLIFTADGHLFKMYSNDGNTNDIGLGIKYLEWSPLHGVLALGDYNDKVTILSKNTVIRPQVAGLWVEADKGTVLSNC